jgi:hypothetical protein
MINRRDFVAGLPALAAFAAAPLARADGAPPAFWPFAATSLVIIDRSLRQAAGFAAEAMVAGYVQLFERDAAALWMNEIEPRLRAGPVAIGGLTSAGTLFCLELMARDYGAEVEQRQAVDSDAVRWLLRTQPERRAALAPGRG